MLEKIGLPAKPSMRGGNWVLDASHCQGCSSQFTFINRKHHCRRCGGLFCNNCTLQRMVLRGQGDAPVRICEPCKKLEEAARFELRYGHRKRIGKGSTKQVPKNEDEVIGQILGTDGKHVSEHESDVAMIVDLQRATSSASCSDFREESAAFGSEEDIVRSMSVDAHNHGTGDISGDPEELRQQAVEEKRKYKILKGEGKSEEALRAFKRGKELERQASALEIALRKNWRMASKASNFAAVARIEKIDGDEETGVKQKLTSRMAKESKGDLSSELRELGWSETDLHDSENKHAKLSLEGELSNLLREATQRSSQGLKKGGIDNSEVIALKKRALLLKKEGKLAEAKEELKKAKILEKKIEEQELLGEDEDSDDELYALIRGMDEDKQDELALGHASEAGFRFDSILVSEDLPTDGNFEATDGDMHDPELAAALKAFGWSDGEEEQVTSQGEQLVTFDREAVRNQVLSLKREAVSQKRAGNISEAMELLKKAKLLEKELEGSQDTETMVSDSNRQNSSPQVHADAVQSVQNENAAETMSSNFRALPKSKLTIQKELLALKKKALTLRREGRIDEAEEELKKGKVLEQQLEEMESASRKHEGELRKGNFLESQQEQIEIDPRKAVDKAGWKNLDATHLHESGDRSLEVGEETLESEVTEQDMHDPALLSLLNNLGWKEDDNVESVRMTITTSKQMNDQSERGNGPFVASVKVKRSKADIQKELLAIKRKALALRRQGKTEESEEELEKAKALENQIAEMEVSSNANFVEVNSLGFDKQQASQDAQNSSGNLTSFAVNLRIPEDEAVPLRNVPDVCVAVKGEKTSAPESFVPAPEIADISRQMSGRSGLTAEGVPSITPQSNQTRESFGGLSRKDDKALQSLTGDPLKIRDTDINIFSIAGTPMKPGVEDIPKEKMRSPVHQVFQSEQRDAGTNNRLASPEKKLADGVDALRDEILSHKRKAVALKREGKLIEAREELRQAKLLEKNLEDGQQTVVVKEVASVSVESTHDKQEHKTSPPEKPLSGRDRFKIQQQSLSHKRNALKLRRAGKIDESEAEFELAKALEKQLEEFDQGSSSNKSDAMDDVGVEDLLDPQLISALKAIGLDDTVDNSPPQKKTEPQPILDRSSNQQVEKANLEEQIKAEKLRALNFKREGKHAEALEALRSAKRLEKKLASLN